MTSKQDKEALAKEILKDKSITKVKVAITDIDGILRGKYIHKDKFQSILDGGFGFCDVVFGWDSSDKCYENADFTGWHTGYPDAKAKLDLSTYRKVPWDNDVPFFLGHFEDEDGTRLDICPRNLLRKITEDCEGQGYDPAFSQEFEWFNFREDPQDLHDRGFRDPQHLTPGMFGYSLLRSSQNNDFFNELFDLLYKFDVPIEGLHTETGPGVYEAAILYTHVLEAADRAVLFKAGAKEIGSKHGIMPTFMPKFSESLPGCSGHIHQSLWDKSTGKNLFYDEKSSTKMSSFMESYIAGLLTCLPEVLPMYAPTINSFKRLVEGAWAPTTLTWGIDNRTTAIRALPGSANSTRIELRVPGSDSNPYLAMSAALASGLYGVKNNLKLSSKPVIGNGYEDKSNGILPGTLKDATKIFKNSKIANELFGESFVKHFSQTREWECRQFDQAVTDWEVKRYFEII
jgi:glutamine synthetase